MIYITKFQIGEAAPINAMTSPKAVKMNQTGPENLPYSLSIEPRKLIPASNKNRPIRKEMAPTKKKQFLQRACYEESLMVFCQISSLPHFGHFRAQKYDLW
jgi:hypothetical protein